MNNLIRLEQKRNSTKAYRRAVFIITAVMLGFLYMVAVIPQLEQGVQDVKDAEIFKSYIAIASLNGILFMSIYAILAGVMFSKFVVSEYTGKRAILLFSYPVSRRKVFFAKIILVSLFTVGGTCFSGVVAFGIFYLSESVLPICSDSLSWGTVAYSGIIVFIFALMAISLGIIAMYIGFRKRSVQVTIVAAVILVVVACQILSVTLSNLMVLCVLTLLSVVTAIFLLGNLARKVSCMEVK